MSRYIALLLLITTTSACSTSSKKHSDSTQPSASNLTPTDLLTPNFEPLKSTDFKSIIESQRDLFEYNAPDKTGLLLANTVSSEQCYADFFKKYPITISGNYMRFQFDNTQEFINCFLTSFKEAIEKAAADSKGSITITPSDPNKPYDPAADCAASANDSSGTIPKAGGNIQSEIFSDKDLGAYQGKTVAEIAAANSGQKYFLPFDHKGRTLTQSKSFSDGSICTKKVYSTYTGRHVQVEDCHIEKQDATTSIWNCSNSYSTVVTNATMTSAAFETLRKGEYGDHYLKDISENVVKKAGSVYPLSGKKTVTYRNWQGTISFNGGQPTYQFSNGTETVAGTFSKN